MVSTENDDFWNDNKDKWEEHVMELEKDAKGYRAWYLFERFTTVVFIFSTGYFLYHAIRFFNQ